MMMSQHFRKNFWIGLSLLCGGMDFFLFHPFNDRSLSALQEFADPTLKQPSLYSQHCGHNRFTCLLMFFA
ncbi:hypothetical protein [Paenibacillus illinoisensis]|uniref:hypothetical protein n=1 Tax=Paenibacillus illinoisensis TaxID=59845 RepID=UPI001C653204|nr:hypothetical protein [Paenibacillus illinoisensis]